MNKLKAFNFNMVTKRPKMILLIAIILTILSGFLATKLDVELSWVSLAPKGHDAVQEYQSIMDDFPTLSNIIVVIESEDKEQMIASSHELELKLNALDKYVASVTAGVDQDFMIDYGLLLASEKEIQEAAYSLMDPSLDGFINNLFYMMSMDSITSNQDEITYLLNQSRKLLEVSNEYSQGNPDKEKLESLLMNFYTGGELITSENGKMTMMMIQPTFDLMDIELLSPGVDAIEKIVEEVSNNYSDVRIGATGMHVVGRDETASIKSDSSLTTIMAVVAIFILLYFAFRAVSAPILTFVPLLIGIVWAVGLTSIVVGRLNMMTAFSAAMLMGLGIDYAIHLYSSYTERLSIDFNKEASLKDAIYITGPSIIIGGLTTAIAFFTLNVSELELLKELGTVMGLGIICTLISVFWILPSLLMLKKESQTKTSKVKGEYKWIGKTAEIIQEKAAVVSVVLVVLTLFMGYHASKIEFDLNLMNLEPVGLESIDLMNRLVEEYEISSDSFSVEVDSLDDVYRFHDAYSKVDGVKEVSSIATILPIDNELEKNKNLLKDFDRLNNQVPFMVTDLDEHISKLENVHNLVEVLLNTEGDLGLLKNDLLAFNEAINMTISNVKQNSNVYNNFETDFYDISSDLSKRMLTPKTLTIDELPINFKNQFVSKDGNKFLINIYPDFDIWSNMDTEKGDKFFKDISDVNSNITGTPIFMSVLFESVSSQMVMIGSLLAIILLVILVLHFKSVKYAIFALVPLLLTIMFTMGTMHIIDLKFNMLNFLAILLIIGIGIDDGVHVLHHYKTGDKNIDHLFSSVGRAILLTTVTTICGFGSLAFSSYRGIASLGIALSIGVLYAFIMTVVVLPLLLKKSN